MDSKITGYAYDIFKAGQMIKHISDATSNNVDQYPDCCTSFVRINNVTAPNWEFIAIGFSCEPMNVHFPCLMHNTETDDWAYSTSLIWFESKQGFCWNGGRYVKDKQTAVDEFQKLIAGLVYYTEDY